MVLNILKSGFGFLGYMYNIIVCCFIWVVYLLIVVFNFCSRWVCWCFWIEGFVLNECGFFCFFLVVIVVVVVILIGFVVVSCVVILLLIVEFSRFELLKVVDFGEDGLLFDIWFIDWDMEWDICKVCKLFCVRVWDNFIWWRLIWVSLLWENNLKYIVIFEIEYNYISFLMIVYWIFMWWINIKFMLKFLL